MKLQYYQLMDDVKEKIQGLRDKGWTLSAIADELGAHRETVYGWIARGHSPANLKLVSNALDALERRRIPKQRRYEPGSRTRSGDGV